MKARIRCYHVLAPQREAFKSCLNYPFADGVRDAVPVARTENSDCLAHIPQLHEDDTIRTACSSRATLEPVSLKDNQTS